MRSLNRFWVLTGLLLAAGCEDGTSTGNPTEEPRGGEEHTGNGSADCKVTSAMDIALDADTPLGFKASDVLSFVEGTHEEKITWNPQDGFEYGPESGEHQLTLRIRREGAPRLTHYTPERSGGIEIAFPDGDCSDAIEIDLEVEVESDQGALDETFSTTLIARSDKLASIHWRPKDDQLNGSFRVTNISLPNAQVVQLTLSVQLTKYGTQGSFSGILEQRQGGAVSAGASRDPIASWGPRDCGYHGTPVPRSANLDGFSADDVLGLVNRSSTGSITFSGGAPSSATLEFLAQGEHACAVLDDGYATFGGAGSVYVRATLRIMSADGRVDANWPVGLTAKRAADALEKVTVTFDDAQLMPSGDFAARYGIRGIDVSRFDSAIASLSLEATPQAPLDGELKVTGFTNASCDTGVNPDGSTNGCPGATQTVAAEARISARVDR